MEAAEKFFVEIQSNLHSALKPPKLPQVSTSNSYVAIEVTTAYMIPLKQNFLKFVTFIIFFSVGTRYQKVPCFNDVLLCRLEYNIHSDHKYTPIKSVPAPLKILSVTTSYSHRDAARKRGFVTSGAFFAHAPLENSRKRYWVQSLNCKLSLFGAMGLLAEHRARKLNLCYSSLSHGSEAYRPVKIAPPSQT